MFVSVFNFLCILRSTLISTLFPYTTLFRSLVPRAVELREERCGWTCFGHTLAILACEADSRNRPDATGKPDRKSTRLNSSHVKNSYAVFCMKKKKYTNILFINNINNK